MVGACRPSLPQLWRRPSAAVDGKAQTDDRQRDDRWNPAGTPELGKWSGRLDSNRRPPAPKCHVLQLSATLRDNPAPSR